jgi:hypothetical protein
MAIQTTKDDAGVDIPKPFILTKTEEILEFLGRLVQRIEGAGH